MQWSKRQQESTSSNTRDTLTSKSKQEQNQQKKDDLWEIQWSSMSSRKENYESTRVTFAKVKDISKEIVSRRQLKSLKNE